MCPIKLKSSHINSVISPVIIGQFGPPTLACIRSWGRQGFPVGMVCMKYPKESNPSSKYLTNFTILPSEKLHTPEGIQVICEFLKSFQATGITCVAENIACWIHDNKHLFPSEVALWIPHSKTIHELNSKQKQIEVAHTVGFKVLPTHYIEKEVSQIHSIPSGQFPLCLRPSEPKTVEPSFKVKLVSSQKDLMSFIGTLHKIEKPIIAQPFLNKPNYVVHGARTVTGSTIGMQAFLVERKFEGVTLTIRPTQLDTDLQNKCIDFVNHFNITGNYHFEFLIDQKNDAVYFLELNNRLGGTTAKVYACGYDEPLFALQAYGVEGNNQSKVNDVTVSSKRALLKYLIYTLKGKLTPFDYPSGCNLTRLAKTIYGFFRYKDDVFTLHDLRGSLALYWSNLKNKLSSQ